jgi:hypothetical protein
MESSNSVEPLQVIEGHRGFLNGKSLMDIALDHARTGWIATERPSRRPLSRPPQDDGFLNAY